MVATERTCKFPLSDVMMSALAMFSLKYSSLLQRGKGLERFEVLDGRYVLGAKEDDHRFLYDWVAKTRESGT